MCGICRSTQRYKTDLDNIVRLQRIVSGRPCVVVFILANGGRTWMVLSPEWEWTRLVEILLEQSRRDLNSELTVKQCGKWNLALKLFSDRVITGNVDIYWITRVCNIPDEILHLFTDLFLVQFGKNMMPLVSSRICLYNNFVLMMAHHQPLID